MYNHKHKMRPSRSNHEDRCWYFAMTQKYSGGHPHYSGHPAGTMSYFSFADSRVSCYVFTHLMVSLMPSALLVSHSTFASTVTYSVRAPSACSG